MPLIGFSMAMEARDRATLLRRTVSNRSFSSLPISYTSSSSVLKSETITSPYPLKGRDVVLDLESRRQYEELRRDIRKLGGRIVDTVDENKLPFVKERKVRLLRRPFIKWQDSRRHYAPSYKECSTPRWTTVYCGPTAGNCVFRRITAEQLERRKKEGQPLLPEDSDPHSSPGREKSVKSGKSVKCPAAPLSTRLPDITPKEEPIFPNDGTQDFEYNLRTDMCSLPFCRTAKNL
uniref:Uncharacterized protein n=1 Tax=Angiostrongylus cantonensis TaxID=6313 RepID=A0A158PAW9_ANGCA